MHRYETPNDIPHHLQDCCESWHTGYRFVHPFRVEVFPFESDPDLIAELQRAEDAFFSSFKSRNWMFTIDMIVGWKHRFRYLNSLIEPAIPRNAEGDRAYWSLIVHIIRNSPILHGQEAHILRALDCSRRGKAATLFGDGFDLLKKMDEPIVGWRGVRVETYTEATGAIKNGFSWTTTKDNALWFAKQSLQINGQLFVARTTLNISDVEAYIPGQRTGGLIIRPSVIRAFDWEVLDSK